jgi:asparagine synthase (glutamine-hydrolysing)
MDAGETTMPVEARHPFVDLRLLRYMLAVPPLPWCRKKYLVRRAMRDTLPASVVHRPKSPLTGAPMWEAAQHQNLKCSHTVQSLSQFVDFDRVAKHTESDPRFFYVDLRPVALNYWLRNLDQKPKEVLITSYV